jgi:hypothetical protein
MQVLVLAVQNAVGYEDLGVATSGATLFRSIGGAVGTAVLGSIFSNRLSAELGASLPASAGASGKLSSAGAGFNPAALAKLPAAIHTVYITAFTNALSTVFVVAASVAAFAFLLSWTLQQRTLRDSVAAGSGIGETFAIPKHTDSLAEASRALTVLVGREGRRALVERLAQRAGVDLSPAACWLIIRLHEDPDADIPALCASFDIPLEVGEQARNELTARSLVVEDPRPDGRPGRELMLEGSEIVERLIEERRASLERLCDGWEPEHNPELAGLLVSLAHDLAQEPPVAVGAGA